ncbi:MAG: hypothetical protein JJ896_09370 [Rhodothermales bacterium]|nr:hypothetical protein [Rhodothermales bacterium]MBO6779847.1 hypothetical protein [Rhodothermales bacterium]
MSDERTGREIRFSELNWLGRAVYLTGHVARAAGSVLEMAVDQAAELFADAEKAFKEGLDPGVEDAKILEEYEEPRRKKK